MENNTANMKKAASATDTIEAGMFVNLLKNNGIPAYTVDREGGDYLKVYMGYTVYGIDIYVNEKDYVHASALLRELAPSGEISSQKEQNKVGQTDDEYGENGSAEGCGEPSEPRLIIERHTAARIIIAVFVALPCAFVILGLLVSTLTSIVR